MSVVSEMHGRITRPKHVYGQSQFGRLKPTCDTHVIHFDYALEQLYHKKRSLKNGKLEANRASETEDRTSAKN